jgi:Ca2+-binding RTX toxin-like protein
MVLLCGALLVGVIVLSGVALAKDIRGTFKQDDLRGTNLRDRIYGLARADTLGARAGNDDCYGGSGFGEDELLGGPANDTILAADGQVDYVNCGLGDNDTAYVDVIDEVDPAQATICEHIFEATEVTTSTEVTTPAEEVTTPPSP